MTLKAPFPWFGGKSRAASMIWQRLGDVGNYVEPFAGSLAVLLARPHEPRIETANDRDCVAPETRILRADMSWAPAGDVKVGDQLIAFDEQNGEARSGLRAPKRYRRLARATVTEVRVLRKPSYRLTFDDGTSVVASANHLWLGGSHRTGGRGWRWLKTENMVCNRSTQRSWVLKVADVVEREAEAILRSRGFGATRVGPRRCRQLNITGGMVDTLALLMQFRPHRLIKKLADRLGELSLYGREHRAVGLVAKEFLGEQTVIAIETDTHTFIAEGLASHNCYLANFWRAVYQHPDEVAKWADWPVNECDLHARHRWLVEQPEFREKMLADPDYCDTKIAGWWVWGISQWIGAGWCSRPEWVGRGAGGRAPRGINTDKYQQRPSERGAQNSAIYEWMHALADRLRRVRVCCGDWSRIVTPSCTWKLGGGQLTGVLLDPPYAHDMRDNRLYSVEQDISHQVREWAIKAADNPRMRIALCGLEGEHDMPAPWTSEYWRAPRGYSKTTRREVIWFSPYCLPPQANLFAGSQEAQEALV